MDFMEEWKKSKAWGGLVSIDLKGCNPESIRSKEHIENFIDHLLNEIKMSAYGSCNVIHFGDDPAVTGYSFFQLIQTSNISGHFAEIDNSAYIDIFSCKPFNPDLASALAMFHFEAEHIKLTNLLRK